ncbi:amidohydrolase family protein [Brevibacterium sp. 50QC2O2]|uniref:N-acyl-D-amino-acid deacylase family protein n=1 Tax=Brevibacterium sp. 50QC2O2 TaxID=2968459 RepID=UPI00211C8CB3|nr:amidohydrolase family protein [Brevibacterium sp. 50QC2O2]
MKTLITAARVIDGTGRAPFVADVLIDGQKIEAIREPGTFTGLADVKTVSADGMVLSPGFIDTHAHADNSPLLDKDDTSKIMQGCTTEVNGNCGFSLAPIDPLHEDGFYTLVTRIFPAAKYGWRSFAEYKAAMNQHEYVTNFATLIGHNTVRVAAMGDEMRAPDKTEMRTMQHLVDDAIENGAGGLSSGLIYPPGVFSEPSELVTLASNLPPTAIYASHMRSESHHLMDSLRETVHVAQNAGIRCHISHLKFADRQSSSQMATALEYLDAQRTAGLPVTQDMYPYSAASTMMTALLPPWMHDGGAQKLLGRLKSRELVRRAGDQIASSEATFENYARTAGWDGVIVASTGSHRYEGESVAQIAATMGVEPIEAVARMLIDEQLHITVILWAMREEDVALGLQHPFTMIGTDGLPVGTGGKPHPRGYGSFARMLDHYVRRTKAVDLVDAIRRMTSLPAQTFGLEGRGVVAEGAFADLVLFDPDTLTDNATFAHPTDAPAGLFDVFVAGEHVVDRGAWTGRRAGKFLAARH